MTEPKQMIVTAQPEASEAGARVLMRGGNAVDAAITAALVEYEGYRTASVNGEVTLFQGKKLGRPRILV